MQIVIDISEKTVNEIKGNAMFNGMFVSTIPSEILWDVINAIVNGTPLPKGHGRLIDADDIDNHIIGHVDTRNCPTIIEADTAESEE